MTLYTATERAVLEALAALGTVSWDELQQELADIPPQSVRCALDRLVMTGDVGLRGQWTALRYTIGDRP